MSAVPLLGAESGQFCRVCHSAEVDAKSGVLVSPCLCTGSVQNVHRGCLEQWAIAQRGLLAPGAAGTGAARCELCGFEYRFESRSTSTAEALGALCRSAINPVLLCAVVASTIVACFGVQQGAFVSGSLLGLSACSATFRFLVFLHVLAKSRRHLPEGPLSAAVAATLLAAPTTQDNPLLDRAEELRRFAFEGDDLQEAFAEGTESAPSPPVAAPLYMACATLGIVGAVLFIPVLVVHLIVRMELVMGVVPALCLLSGAYALVACGAALAFLRVPVVRSLTDEERQAANDERRNRPRRAPARSRRARSPL